MRQEHLLGAALIILGAILLVLFYNVQAFASSAADQARANGGECSNEHGCIYQQANGWFLKGAVPSILVILAGIYTAYFLEISEYRRRREDEHEFETLLRGLSQEQQAVMRAVKAEDGVTQSTLKYRVDQSKSKLSQTLSELEDRGLVNREQAGRTKRVYLRS